MSALARIKQAGFTLELNGDDLDVIPFSKLTESQRAFLKTHKAQIIQELEREQAANSEHDPFDDRHYCRECRNLINGRCTVQRFRPLDDHPRRCADYRGD